MPTQPAKSSSATALEQVHQPLHRCIVRADPRLLPPSINRIDSARKGGGLGLPGVVRGFGLFLRRVHAANSSAPQ